MPGALAPKVYQLMTPAQLQQLAPDSATLARSQNLAAPRKWAVLEKRGAFRWGHCKSRGVRHYRSVIHLQSLEYYCSCPARRQPCKHVLALFQLEEAPTHSFREAEELPDWIKDWRKKRPPSEAALEEAARQRAAGRQRERDKRIELMQSGAADLEQWLLDLLRQGLAQAQGIPGDYWDEFAGRMIDSKLGSVGRRIQQWKKIFAEENWHEVLLAEIAELYLLARGFRQMDQLSDALYRELLTTAGLSIKKKEVLEQDGITDHWLVIGLREGEEEQLRYRRTWLLGEQSGKIPLLLDFAFGGQGFEQEWKVGMALEGQLVYYPGSYLQRALLKSFEASRRPFQTPAGFADLSGFADTYAEAVGANPWLFHFPALLTQVTPVLHQRKMLLVDQNGKQLPATCNGENHWKLLAVSAGRPLTVFGEWNGNRLLVLSTIEDERLIVLG